jgi:O-antigen/teichoic acid export membrane protein
MGTLQRKMAKGAAWMVLFKLLERTVGLVSTLVLARLLVPEDFGVVAMATSVIALVDIINGFSFDIALIQKQDTEERHYHTAWTLNLLTQTAMALAMIALAEPVAAFYREPRVAPVLYALAIGVFLLGFENIGTVAFRKELQLRRDFNFLLAKKVVAASVGIAAAIAFRSYWALVIGMVTSRFVGVVLSYVVHPFRPRLSLNGARDLMKFSGGLFVYYLVYAVVSRVPDFIIGRAAGPASLGAYNIGAEFANLPTTELLMPIHRAVMPGYAKMSGDREALHLGFTSVFAISALAFVPATVGIAAIAEPLVHTLLGAKWTAVIPAIPILAFAGLLSAFQSNAGYVFMAAGKNAVATRFLAIQLAVLVPAMLVGVRWDGLVGAAWAALTAAAAVLPAAYLAINRELGVTLREYGRALWRPAAASIAMFVVLGLWQRQLDAMGLGNAYLLWLLTSVALGALVYIALLMALWWLAGRPVGPESAVLSTIVARLRRRGGDERPADA